MRLDPGSDRNVLLSIEINRAKFNGNIINKNEAFEKKTFPSSWNRRANWLEKSLVAWSFANAILKFCLKTAGLCFLTSFNWTCEKQRKPLGFGCFVFAGSSSCKHKKTQYDVSRPPSWISAWSQPTETLTRICHTFLSFRTVSCYI